MTQVVALKRVKEVTETNIETLTTVYVVHPGESVDDLIERMHISGKCDWHFSEFEVVLKLVKL